MNKSVENQFKEVLESNQTSIYKICKVYAAPPIEAADLFQEVVFQIWQSLPNFKGQAHINTWVYKITLNVCMRYNKRLAQAKPSMVSLEAIEFKMAETTEATKDTEKFQALQACIQLLTATERSLVILHLENHPHSSIAQTIGITENHVAVKLKRIRKKLLSCIKPKLS